MIKVFSSVVAITLAGASLTACAGMDGGSPKPDAVMTQLGSRQPSVQVLEDQRCGMQEQQGLVGTNLSALARNTATSARVVPAGTNLNQADFVATRLTIMFDARTNLITEVRCG